MKNEKFLNATSIFRSQATTQTSSKSVRGESASPVKKNIKIKVESFNFYYGNTWALKNIQIAIKENNVVGIIGPSGCGKSTFLRCINRMNDIIKNTRAEGFIYIDGKNIYEKDQDVVTLRRDVGMVFQKSNPFPKSVFENVAYGLRINGVKDQRVIAQKVEKSLKDAAIWDEVKDRLSDSPFSLSGGQQQRLCIARALAIEPRILLLDEPASALDPIATSKVEELIHQLKKEYTIIIVTHNMQQAARVSDFSAFFMMGELIEYDATSKIFTNPSNKITEDYVTGRFG
ncbi:MAG: phosphate ABC transporter ATP-binding protein PstB [Candidatus Aceula meridiana]|nr:phosphate ABC transporter ATP-binding protein PstB [Candidatus Aceula meridiana]